MKRYAAFFAAIATIAFVSANAYGTIYTKPVLACPHCPGRVIDRPEPRPDTVKVSGDVLVGDDVPTDFRIKMRDASGNVLFNANAAWPCDPDATKCVVKHPDAKIVGGIQKLTLKRQGGGVWRFRVRGYTNLPRGPIDPWVETFVVINGRVFSTIDVWDRIRSGLKIKRIGEN